MIQAAQKLTKRYGEDIVCRNFGPDARREAHQRAVRLSSGPRHGWARVWYLWGKELRCHVYSGGLFYTVEDWSSHDPWYSANITIRQAIGQLRSQ